MADGNPHPVIQRDSGKSLRVDKVPLPWKLGMEGLGLPTHPQTNHKATGPRPSLLLIPSPIQSIPRVFAPGHRGKVALRSSVRNHCTAPHCTALDAIIFPPPAFTCPSVRLFSEMNDYDPPLRWPWTFPLLVCRPKRGPKYVRQCIVDTSS